MSATAAYNTRLPPGFIHAKLTAIPSDAPRAEEACHAEYSTAFGAALLCGLCGCLSRAGANLQHRRPLRAFDPRRLRQHECEIAERRDTHRGGAARRQGRGRLRPGAGAAFAAAVWRAIAGEPEKLPGHQ